MGFQVEINSILRSDDAYDLARGSEHLFRKSGSRVFFDDLPIFLTRADWTARAEVRITSQTRVPGAVEGTFRVRHVYCGDEQTTLTAIFRRMFADGGDPLIYLLMNPGDYDKAVAEGSYAAPSLASEGFVHASPADQLTRVANKYYTAFEVVRVVGLTVEKLTAELRWEPASNGLYPHVYGPVNMDAAAWVKAFGKGVDGKFEIQVKG